MHPGLAGLLHFVRNDGKGAVNYGSINNLLFARWLNIVFADRLPTPDMRSTTVNVKWQNVKWHGTGIPGDTPAKDENREFPIKGLLLKKQNVILLLLCFSGHSANTEAADDAGELNYFQELPVVLSASRLYQPLSEAPNAMTVIDQRMIVDSGFRNIPDLFKLVPGMYVSYYKGSQAIVSYHGATDQFSRRMQVLIDGRSVYMSPNNTVDWANLPITIDDIERIEVIRGPAAASYGANSTQGVINIITNDAGAVDGKHAKYTRGNKGINDADARFGKRGETFDYRATLGYTADNGYDNLTSAPFQDHRLLNNSNDNNQARLMNYRGNYHPDGANSFDLQFGFNHDIQGVGFNDKNPTPSTPTSTNGNPFHDLIANTSFVQLGWTRALENSSELSVRYYHIQEDQSEAFPVYLGGAYYPGPVAQTLSVGRDQLEVQHTLRTSESNRLVYGANYQTNTVNGQSIMPPLSLALSSASFTEDLQMFANDEWRITKRLLLNIGNMFERDAYGNKDMSPRVSLNFHVTPQNTFRTGISVAYRTPALAETNFPAIQPGALIIPSATATSPALTPEKMVSREIGYLGEFPGWDTTLDMRLFSDLLSNGIFPDTTTGIFVNGMSAEYHGFEATLKKSWNESGNLTLNFAHEFASSNAPALAAAGYSYMQPASSLVGGDKLAESLPLNNVSLLYSRHLTGNYSFSTAYYYQSSLQPFDRGWIDFQPQQHRADLRIARSFEGAAGIKGNVALVVQNLFNQNYSEYIASNVFNQRAYVMTAINW
jgi:iron complex outermembrane receptor protein